MTAEQTMCMCCGERPAEPGEDTVPLCSVCKGKRADSRGVEYESGPDQWDEPEVLYEE
jgi:hypothetical protein